MKTILKKVALVAIAGMLHITNSDAQNKAATHNDMKIYSGRPAQENIETAEESKSGLTLSVVALSNNSNLNDATVKVYHENKLVVVLNSSIQYNMQVELKRNSHYLLEINSPGYITKSIMISTTFPSDTTINYDNTIYEHKVMVSLLKRSANEEVNKTSSVPLTGIVYYDSAQDIFVGSLIIKEASNKQEIIEQIEAWLGS